VLITKYGYEIAETDRNYSESRFPISNVTASSSKMTANLSFQVGLMVKSDPSSPSPVDCYTVSIIPTTMGLLRLIVLVVVLK